MTPEATKIIEGRMIDKFNGCLLGLAIGNTLGTPVGLLTLNDIPNKHGKDRYTEPDAGEIYKPGSLTLTLDMRMSLVVAQVCIEAQRMVDNLRCHEISESVYQKYIEWICSQDNPYKSCLSKKICSNLMWTVPVGLALPAEDAFKMGLEFAAISPNHPSEYLPAGFVAALIAYILAGVTLRDALDLCRNQLITYTGYKEILELVDESIYLSYGFEKADRVIERIGAGRSGRGALAIAIYCSLKYAYNFKQGVVAAVTHLGQSDSAGSITGAILGALLGDEALPMDWIVKLKNSFSISQVAMEMFQIFQNGQHSLSAKCPIG